MWVVASSRSNYRGEGTNRKENREIEQFPPSSLKEGKLGENRVSLSSLQPKRKRIVSSSSRKKKETFEEKISRDNV